MKKSVFVFLLVLSSMLAACGPFPHSVDSDERVIKVVKGNPTEVLHPGESWTDFATPRTEYKTVKVGVREIAMNTQNNTIDNQLITVAADLSYSMTGEDDDLLELMRINKEMLFNVEVRDAKVRSISDDSFRDATALFTIGQLKGAEELTSTQINRFAAVYPEVVYSEGQTAREYYRQILRFVLNDRLAPYSITITDLVIKDIVGSEAYESIIQEQANVAGERNVLNERAENDAQAARNQQQNLVNQQAVLEAEKANRQIEADTALIEVYAAATKTAIEAQAEAEALRQQAEVYAEHPELYALEMARIQGEALANGNTIYVPSDANLNFFISPNVTPVPNP